jgi:hypothetical protein
MPGAEEDGADGGQWQTSPARQSSRGGVEGCQGAYPCATFVFAARTWDAEGPELDHRQPRTAILSSRQAETGTLGALAAAAPLRSTEILALACCLLVRHGSGLDVVEGRTTAAPRHTTRPERSSLCSRDIQPTGDRVATGLATGVATGVATGEVVVASRRTELTGRAAKSATGRGRCCGGPVSSDICLRNEIFSLAKVARVYRRRAPSPCLSGAVLLTRGPAGWLEHKNTRRLSSLCPVTRFSQLPPPAVL